MGTVFKRYQKGGTKTNIYEEFEYIYDECFEIPIYCLYLLRNFDHYSILIIHHTDSDKLLSLFTIMSRTNNHRYINKLQ